MKIKVFSLIVLFSFFSLKTKATDWYLKSSLVSCVFLSSWTDASSGTGGTSPLSFTTANDIWHFQNRPNNPVTFSAAMIFASSSTLIIGDGTNNLKLRLNSNAAFSGTPTILAQNHSTIYINGTVDNFDETKTVFNTGSAVVFSTNYTLIGEIRDYINPYYDLYIDQDYFTSNNVTRFNVAHNLYIGDGTYDAGNQQYVADATSITNFRVMGDIYVNANNCSLSTFTTTNIYVGNGVQDVDFGYNGLSLELGVLSPTTGVTASSSYITGLLIDKSYDNVFSLPSNTTFSNVVVGSMSLTGRAYNISTSTVSSLLDDISQTSSSYSNVTVNNLNLAGTGTYTFSTDLIVGGGFTLSATNGFSLNPANTTPITFSASSCVLNTNLILEASTATISGAISGAGLIVGDNAASLVLNGSSSGSLNLQSPYELQNLTIDGSANVSLGSDLNIISGNFNLLGGTLSLNSRTLSIDDPSQSNLIAGEISDNGTSTFSLGSNNIMGTGLLMSSANNTLSKLITNGNLQLMNSLNIKDYIQVDGGTFTTNNNLTLKANNTLSARVASMSLGSISGNVTVETYIPGGTTGWSLWGANGLPSLIVSDWEAQIPLTCSDCPNTCYSAGGVFFSSIQGWNESSSFANAYLTNISKNDAITSGKGFWVYVGSTSSTSIAYTLSSTGSLNQGNITFPITKSNNNFNLIANPYASPIDFDLFRAQNSSLITTSMYGYNADVAQMGTYVSPAGGANNGVNRIIPAGQAFFVECTSSGNVTFTEAMKTSDNTSANPVLRPSSLSTNLKLKIKGFNGNTDETIISSSPMASIDYDPNYDGKKLSLAPKNFGAPLLNNNATSISTKIGNDNFAVNNVGAIYNTLTIPLLAKASVTGQYTISAEDVLNYAGCVIIKDKISNTFTDLKINPYVFTLNDSTSSPRFELILCPFNKSVSVKELNESNNILISQDENGAFVKTFFEQNTKTVISVYNILGQKIAKDIILNEASAITRLDINNHNQILFVKVVANNQSLTKKIVTH